MRDDYVELDQQTIAGIKTACRNAMRRGDMEALKQGLDTPGFDVDDYGSDGEEALLTFAVERSIPTAVELLLDYGADLLSEDSYSCPAAHALLYTDVIDAAELEVLKIVLRSIPLGQRMKYAVVDEDDQESRYGTPWEITARLSKSRRPRIRRYLSRAMLEVGVPIPLQLPRDWVLRRKPGLKST